MDKNYFLKLLRKYLDGKSTNEESAFIEKYYNLFQQEPDVLDILNPDEKKAFRNNLKDDIHSAIIANSPEPEKVRSPYNLFFKLAAAAVIVMAMLSTVYFFTGNSVKKVDEPAEKTIVLENKKNRVIFLPDGSTVILSYGSKLNYPSTFDGLHTREVYLEGQAFFDIKHNESRPFIVHTGTILTKVLGTAFNIKAYPGEDDITVTVTRGRVSVNEKDKLLGIITPNQQITYAKSKVKSSIGSVKNESYLAWKQEDLLIDNLTISEAAKLIEDRYRVKIAISDPEIESLRFTTTFSKDETLDQTLSSICVFNGLNYTYNKSKTIVNITP
ncbi:MAG: FecR domain-containing protein [Ginsengibacter sp.]